MDYPSDSPSLTRKPRDRTLRAAQETHEMPKQVARFFEFPSAACHHASKSLQEMTKFSDLRRGYFVELPIRQRKTPRPD
jgi:hypothetical protein